MFAQTQAGGMSQGIPDVCLTPAPPGPPMPMPYPNVAQGVMATGFSTKVLFASAPAHTMSTSIPMSSGDNGGLAMGVASGTVMQSCRHLTGAFTVLVEGKPATRLTSVSLQNSTNCPGTRITPSQTKVLLLAP